MESNAPTVPRDQRLEVTQTPTLNPPTQQEAPTGKIETAKFETEPIAIAAFNETSSVAVNVEDIVVGTIQHLPFCAFVQCFYSSNFMPIFHSLETNDADFMLAKTPAKPTTVAIDNHEQCAEATGANKLLTPEVEGDSTQCDLDTSLLSKPFSEGSVSSDKFLLPDCERNSTET